MTKSNAWTRSIMAQKEKAAGWFAIAAKAAGWSEEAIRVEVEEYLRDRPSTLDVLSDLPVESGSPEESDPEPIGEDYEDQARSEEADGEDAH